MRLMAGITGSSGSIFGVRSPEALRELGVETHLTLSRCAFIKTKPSPDDEP